MLTNNQNCSSTNPHSRPSNDVTLWRVNVMKLTTTWNEQRAIDQPVTANTTPAGTPLGAEPQLRHSVVQPGRIHRHRSMTPSTNTNGSHAAARLWQSPGSSAAGTHMKVSILAIGASQRPRASGSNAWLMRRSIVVFVRTKAPWWSLDEAPSVLFLDRKKLSYADGGAKSYCYDSLFIVR